MFAPNQILLNTLSNGQSIKVRVVGAPLANGEYRVTDARETASDKQLIARRKTWAAPAERLKAI